jgi:hypothetical protein
VEVKGVRDDRVEVKGMTIQGDGMTDPRLRQPYRRIH